MFCKKLYPKINNIVLNFAITCGFSKSAIEHDFRAIIFYQLRINLAVNIPYLIGPGLAFLEQFGSRHVVTVAHFWRLDNT
jgi:hypothetical protein